MTKKKKPDLIDHACEMLQLMEAAEEVLRPVNQTLQVLYGDFYPHHGIATQGIENKLVVLLDEILGDELASYYLYECRRMPGGGLIKEKNGKAWPIKSVSDVRKYAKHLAKKTGVKS
ncbi:MAG: hypothetical protein EBR82_68995 [Caulobacteraceae bacterium]|nr:hypothetical protein [Caulobacteraceae bacterium]